MTNREISLKMIPKKMFYQAIVEDILCKEPSIYPALMAGSTYPSPPNIPPSPRNKGFIAGLY